METSNFLDYEPLACTCSMHASFCSKRTLIQISVGRTGKIATKQWLSFNVSPFMGRASFILPVVFIILLLFTLQRIRYNSKNEVVWQFPPEISLAYTSFILRWLFFQFSKVSASLLISKFHWN